MELPLCVVQRVLHPVGVGLIEHVLRVPLPGEDIVNLAHSQAVQARVLDGIQHGFSGGLQGEVVAVGGALEAGGILPHIGSGNHPAHTVLAPENFSCLAAGVVQFFQGNPILIGRHLEHRVGGGIDDPLAGALLLLTVVPDHVGAGIGSIAKHPPAGGRFKFIQNLFRKPLRVGRQGRGRNQARDFPVADGGVLTHGGLPQPGHRTCGGGSFGKAGNPIDIAQSGGDHIGDLKLCRGCTGGQGVDAHIAKAFGIRHLADAEGIQNNQKDALFHITCLPWLRPRPMPPSSWW